MIEHEKELKTVDQHHTGPEKQNRQDNSTVLKELSYVVLFFGAVFIISAMETGSYRTPWPVALIITLAGVVLFGYAHFLKKKEQK
jgi:uncharacterized membrane protein